MYSRSPKFAKSQAPETTPYTKYYFHDKPEHERKFGHYVQVASMDPAQKNFALRIERRYNQGLIVPIVFDKRDIVGPPDENVFTMYDNLTKYLDTYLECFKQCHYIVIERQVPMNYKAVRISQHAISYFLLKLHNIDTLPTIIEINPQLKGKVLGVPKGTSSKDLKKWAVEEADRILKERGDWESLQLMKTIKYKLDDLADTVVQVEALFQHWGAIWTVPIQKLYEQYGTRPEHGTNGLLYKWGLLPSQGKS